MLDSLSLRNFKCFDTKNITLHPKITLIHWENGTWKTSLLECIGVFSNHIFGKKNLLDHIKNWEDSFYIELTYQDSTFSISCNKDNKKLYSVNGKKVSKKIFYAASCRATIFSPITMNLFILWPWKRRDFLDQILISSFTWYEKELQRYNKILKSRNAVLKNIAAEKSQESELMFWDSEFIWAAISIYRYRYILHKFFQENISKVKKHLFDKIDTISFVYDTKVDLNNPGEYIEKYLQDKRSRDIITGKTHIWPHLDDFHILIDGKHIQDFASRWETKSIILWLKLLEAQFIESKTSFLPVILIDDFMSELDTRHRESLLDSLEPFQVLLSNIESLPFLEDKSSSYHLN